MHRGLEEKWKFVEEENIMKNEDIEDNNRRSSDGNIEWTAEMKVNFLEIDKGSKEEEEGL